jgi:hypothetical protein
MVESESSIDVIIIVDDDDNNDKVSNNDDDVFTIEDHCNIDVRPKEPIVREVDYEQRPSNEGGAAQPEAIETSVRDHNGMIYDALVELMLEYWKEREITPGANCCPPHARQFVLAKYKKAFESLADKITTPSDLNEVQGGGIGPVAKSQVRSGASKNHKFCF